MAQRKLISIQVDNTSNTVIRKMTQYNIMLTERGIKVKTITRKRTHLSNGKRSSKNNKILFKIYKQTNQKERVKVKSGNNTKPIVRKSQMKKMEQDQEESISKAMQQLSFERKSIELGDKPEQKQRKK